MIYDENGNAVTERQYTVRVEKLSDEDKLDRIGNTLSRHEELLMSIAGALGRVGLIGQGKSVACDTVKQQTEEGKRRWERRVKSRKSMCCGITAGEVKSPVMYLPGVSLTNPEITNFVEKSHGRSCRRVPSTIVHGAENKPRRKREDGNNQKDFMEM